MTDNRPVYIVQHNHFDPIWRRCWNRSFMYEGRQYRPYSELERRVFDIWIENAKRGATFSEGQAAVVRKYVENRPEMLPVLQDFVRRSLFELTAGGETVPDTNMPSGETLLRNFVMGARWFEDTFGVIPSVGWLEDAFGQSAQIPQILRGCEVKHVCKLSYKRVPGSYWRGLDGSVIFTAEPPFERGCGSFYKIPPCEKCLGAGCSVCGRTGFADSGHITDEHIREALSADYPGDPFSMLSIGGEESIPNPRLPEIVAEAKSKPGAPDFRFGSWADLAREYADLIAKVDDPDLDVSEQVEANPVSTGCYVTRIEIKKAFRSVENRLIAAEKWMTVAWLQGENYIGDHLARAWRSLLFVAFHDAITSTHINSAYFELMDMLSAAGRAANAIAKGAAGSITLDIAGTGRGVVLFNSEGWARRDVQWITADWIQGTVALRDASTGEPVEIIGTRNEGDAVEYGFRTPEVPPLGYRTILIEPADAPLSAASEETGPGVIENEFFRITASEKGIVSVFDKRLGSETADTAKYLVNELVLEEDVGHPWGTQKQPEFEEGFSKYTSAVSITRSAGFAEIRVSGKYAGNDPNVEDLKWTQTATLWKGVPRIDFRTDVDWDTAQRRIRVAFPTPIKTSEAMYAIPYGAVRRGTYEPELDIMPSTNGDWPAVNWVDVYDETNGWGVGLLNTGTPSHKVSDGVVFMSILRSPTDSWCLNEPEFYDCPDFDGARDAGAHTFTYALVPHSGDWRAAGIERLGREFNTPIQALPLRFTGKGTRPAVHSFLETDATPNVVISAIKKADRDDSVIVRLAETDGMEGHASVSLEGAGAVVSATNYLERADEPAGEGPIALGPYKVVTLRLRRKP